MRRQVMTNGFHFMTEPIATTTFKAKLPYLSLLQESLKKQSQPKDKPADVRTLSICSPMAT